MRLKAPYTLYRRLSICGLLFLVISSSPSQVSGQSKEDYIVSYKMGVHPDVADLLSHPDIMEVTSIFKDLNLWCISLRSSSKKKAAIISRLKNNKGVRYVHESLVATNRQIPNDPDYPAQWSLPLIGMEQVWDITTGGQNVIGHDIVIGILDDGYQLDHPDLANSIWVNSEEIEDNGFDDDGNGFIDDAFGWNALARDDNHLISNHGTSVAGIIGATSNNNSQMTGINWDVKLMLTSSGSPNGYSLPLIVKSYEYIYEQRKLYNNSGGERGAYVVATNYSGGTANRFPEDFPSWCEVYDQLGSIGIINVGATDNTNINVEEEGDLPSTCTSDFLIVTTNTGRINQKVENAGYGNVSVDLGAPGDDIFTLTRNDGTTEAFFGTSAAAPHIAGVISLMYHIMCEEAYDQSISDPSSLAAIVKSAILDHVTPAGGLADLTVTGGVLNALASIQAIDETIGDCCEVNISDLTVTPESCTGADDGILSVTADGEDLMGNLLYQLTGSGSGGEQENNLGEFDRLVAQLYQLTVSDGDNPLCFTDTMITVAESLEICPFGAFEISEIRNDLSSGLVSIVYDLDEQKDIYIQIHDSVGRLLYNAYVRPSLNEGRTHEVNTVNYPAGVYHASILANGLRSVSSFIVVH